MSDAERSISMAPSTTELLGVAAHELRRPIAIALGYLSLLETGLRADSEAGRAALGQTATQLRYANEMITRLLQASRLDADRSRTVFERVDLAEVMQTAASRIGPTVPSTHRLEVAVPSGGIPVEGDREALVSVLTNLLENAIKYSPRGGDVRMRGEPERAGLAHVYVDDEGIGIEKNNLSKIFSAFERVPLRKARQPGGAGLGLYIAHRIVRIHGGTLSVKSKLGVGSTFTVELPAFTGPRHALAPSA
jgi:signal transduction histidine kinase